MDSINAEELITHARTLIDEMPNNPEYVRGIIELLANVLGIDGSIVRAFMGQ